MKRTVIITGADGFLGGKISRRILNDTNLDILGLTLDLTKIKAMMEREGIKRSNRIRFITNDEFMAAGNHLNNIYGAVHLAFSRRMQPAKDIASSIDFAADVFHRLFELGVDHVINMSSQGIYGNTDEIRTESTPPAPETQYTMAKYSAEVLFKNIMGSVPHHTNFRLDAVAQSQNIVKGLCRSAKEGVINLRGGKQIFSFIDAEDVGSAVVAMLHVKGNWDNIYNIGWNRKRYGLLELAEIIADMAEECGYKRPEIKLNKDSTCLWAGMDSTRFMEKTGWKPEIDLYSTIKKILKDN